MCNGLHIPSMTNYLQLEPYGKENRYVICEKSQNCARALLVPNLRTAVTAKQSVATTVLLNVPLLFDKSL